MSRMKDLVIDIEDHLRQGFKPLTVAAMMNIPVDMVEDVEKDLMQLADPRFFGPDYDE
jgi:hypothetical protein